MTAAIMLEMDANTRSGRALWAVTRPMIPRFAACSFTSCPARGAINMKDPSTSVLQDRFRPLAICYVGSAPVNSVDGQLHQHQD